MTQYGDVVKVPGTDSVSEVSPGDILASYARLTQRGCTVLKESSGEVIAAGTVLGRITASGLYVPYDEDGVDDGREVAVGVLRQAVDTTGGNALGNIFISGIIKYDLLVGIDAGAVADLNGRYDEVMNTFIF